MIAALPYSSYYFEIVEAPRIVDPEPPRFATREEWLTAFVNYMRPVFVAAGSPFPEKIRISCAFPIRTSKAIGQILSDRLSTDGTREIFISPVLSEASRVCDVVIHELVHAALPDGSGHGPVFRRLALKLGLTGRMTATAAGPKLATWLAENVPVFLGPYPDGMRQFIHERFPGVVADVITPQKRHRISAKPPMLASETIIDMLYDSGATLEDLTYSQKNVINSWLGPDHRPMPYAIYELAVMTLWAQGKYTPAKGMIDYILEKYNGMFCPKNDIV